MQRPYAILYLAAITKLASEFHYFLLKDGQFVTNTSNLLIEYYQVSSLSSFFKT